ncbi:MAG: NAD(P)/FAD-dependent oxidoreductase [Candidatus Lokiarchaeota archaeon]|nr:NAD(P)/FAD-dependent oxidoreductase [Candidatus Lokiarchaeota archaeon]
MDQNIEKCDLAIIGASIAGNYLCYLLSKTNLKIVVIEEHEEVGLPFQCAGIISQKLSKLIDLPDEIILNRVKTAKIVGPSGAYIKLSGKEEPYIIDRIGLDRSFFNKIKQKENIVYLFGERFKNFKYLRYNHQKLVLIETSKRKLKAKMLVGCDGPLSSVAKSLGIRNKNLYAIQIRIKAQFDENEAVMFFDKQWKELFGWIVPEGKNLYRIGIASSKNIAKNFRVFLNRLNLKMKQKIDQQGGLIPFGLMNKLAFENILLIGDSACQVKATTGGGIIMLLIAAKYAANCIKTCFKQKNFSKKTIKKYYEIPCRSIIGRELKTHYLIRLFLERFSEKDFEKLFQIIKTTKIENHISLYGDMDFPKALIFQLLKNPFVISFFFKFLMKNPELLVRLLFLIFFK